MTASRATSAAVPTVDVELGRIPRLVLVLVALVGVVPAFLGGFSLLWYVPYVGMGVLLVVRRPRQIIGWLLVGLGVAFVIVAQEVPGTPAELVAGTLPPAVVAFMVIGTASGPTIFFLFGLLAVVFPSGRLPDGRGGTVARVALVAGLIGLGLAIIEPTVRVGWSGGGQAVVPNPLRVLPSLPVWQVITPDTAILPIVALMVGSAVSLFVRYFRATGIERQQLRWITAALVLVVIAVVGGFVVGQLVPAAEASGVVWVGAALAFPTVPIGVAIAVLRYRLYEIDTIINRAIVYVTLTALLAGVMAATVTISKQLLEGVLGSTSDASSIIATLVVVAAFEPVKSRVQAFVDRRWKAGSDPASALERFVAEARRSLGPLDAGRALRRLLETAIDASGAMSGTVRWSGALDGGSISVVGGSDGRTGRRAVATSTEPGDGEAAGALLSVSAAAMGREALLELVGASDRADPADLRVALQAILAELPEARAT